MKGPAGVPQDQATLFCIWPREEVVVEHQATEFDCGFTQSVTRFVRVGLLSSDINLTPFEWREPDKTRRLHVYDLDGRSLRSELESEVVDRTSVLPEGLHAIAIDVNWPNEHGQQFGLIDAVEVLFQLVDYTRLEVPLILLTGDSSPQRQSFFYDELYLRFNHVLWSSTRSIDSIAGLWKDDIWRRNHPSGMRTRRRATLYELLMRHKEVRRALGAASLGITNQARIVSLMKQYAAGTADVVSGQTVANSARNARMYINQIDGSTFDDDSGGFSFLVEWLHRSMAGSYVRSFMRRYATVGELYGGDLKWLPRYLERHPG